MPESLHDWVELWFGPTTRQGNASDMVEPLFGFNHPPAEPWAEGDVAVLVVENQGVWLWGRTRRGEFVERENDPGLPWRVIAEDDEAFWLHHAAFEALWVMPATRSALQLDRASVLRLEDSSTPLPCAEWSWPGDRQRMRFHDASLIMICEDGDGFWVVVAARTEEDLTWLDRLALEWDESDSRLA